MIVTNQPVAQRGTNLLTGYAIGAVVMMVMNIIVFRLLDHRYEAASNVLQVLWLGLTIVFAIGVIMIGTAVDRPGLAWALVGLAATNEIFSLGFTLLRVFLPDSSSWWSLASTPSTFLGLAERVVFLVFIVKLCGPAKSWATPVAFVIGGVALTRLGLTFATSFIYAQAGRSAFEVVTWLQALFAMALVVLSLVLTLAARSTVAAASSAAVPHVGEATPSHLAAAAEPTNAGADLAIGGILLAVGIAVTVASFAIASSSGGGRYVIATGLIAVGLGRLIRGFIRMSRG